MNLTESVCAKRDDLTSIELNELMAQQISFIPMHWLIGISEMCLVSRGGEQYNEKAISTIEWCTVPEWISWISEPILIWLILLTVTTTQRYNSLVSHLYVCKTRMTVWPGGCQASLDICFLPYHQGGETPSPQGFNVSIGVMLRFLVGGPGVGRTAIFEWQGHALICVAEVIMGGRWMFQAAHLDLSLMASWIIYNAHNSKCSSVSILLIATYCNSFPHRGSAYINSDSRAAFVGSSWSSSRGHWTGVMMFFSFSLPVLYSIFIPLRRPSVGTGSDPKRDVVREAYLSHRDVHWSVGGSHNGRTELH